MTTCVHRVQKSKGAQYGTTVVLHLVVLLMLHGTAADNLPWVANELRVVFDHHTPTDQQSYYVWKITPCHIETRPHDRLGNQITSLFAAVHTAARLHTPVNVTHTLGRVEVKWDIPWMMGLFGENDSLALWDLRKHPEQEWQHGKHCYGAFPVNAWGCCEGYLPMPVPTTHSLREVVQQHVGPIVQTQVQKVAPPDPDALVIYLRAGDIFDASVDKVNFDYVQAPCAYLRRVIRDSGLFKINIVTDPTTPHNMRHPCLPDLTSMHAPYNVTMHGSSVLEDFGFVMQAHTLVLTGVSSFADCAVLLSSKLRVLYAFSWQLGEHRINDRADWHTAGSFVSYHDLHGVDVRRYVAPNYVKYWTVKDGLRNMTSYREEWLERVGRYENIPSQHISSQHGVLMFAPSHSLTVVVHACDGFTSADMLLEMLRMLETDRYGQRIPIIVLAEDVHAAHALQQRLGIAAHPHQASTPSFAMRNEKLQVVQPELHKHRHAQGDNMTTSYFQYNRMYGLAIVAPKGGRNSTGVRQTCGAPSVGVTRAAIAVSHATYNTSHLLFVQPSNWPEFAHGLFPGLQHTHGHQDVLRAFVHAPLPLCPHTEDNYTQQRALFVSGCSDVYGFLVSARGGHVLRGFGNDTRLDAVCWKTMAEGECMYNFAVTH